MTADERQRRIEQYATGAQRLREAVGRVPVEARAWRPSPDEFSVHEIACHCADSETNAAARIRYLVAEKEPVILGYDPMNWAVTLDYQSHPLDAALAAVEAVRANTVPILRRLPEAAWASAGTHSESGRFTAEDWLRSYSDHIEQHIEQVAATYAAWEQRGRG
jgi:hypothetical protein